MYVHVAVSTDTRGNFNIIVLPYFSVHAIIMCILMEEFRAFKFKVIAEG